MKTSCLPIRPHLAIPLLLLAGCMPASEEQILGTPNQVQVRSFQHRAYDTTRLEQVMRAVIATLQDLGFVLEKADRELGMVTGSKFVHAQNLRITVTVRPRGTTQTVVRANAQYGIQALHDPKEYQDFFTSLDKSLFLAGHEVD